MHLSPTSKLGYLSFKKYYYTWPSINKFKLLLSTQSKNIIQNIAKYLDEAFKIRK